MDQFPTDSLTQAPKLSFVRNQIPEVLLPFSFGFNMKTPWIIDATKIFWRHRGFRPEHRQENTLGKTT